MKQVFIFVGDPATGKTVLGNLINANAIVFDDFLPHLANEFDSERLKYYDYAIYITNNPKNVDIIKNHFPDTPVSVCEFRR